MSILKILLSLILIPWYSSEGVFYVMNPASTPTVALITGKAFEIPAYATLKFRSSGQGNVPIESADDHPLLAWSVVDGATFIAEEPSPKTRNLTIWDGSVGIAVGTPLNGPVNTITFVLKENVQTVVLLPGYYTSFISGDIYPGMSGMMTIRGTAPFVVGAAHESEGRWESVPIFKIGE